MKKLTQKRKIARQWRKRRALLSRFYSAINQTDVKYVWGKFMDYELSLKDPLFDAFIESR